MEKKVIKVAKIDEVEYLESLYFRYQSLEMIMKMQYIPSQYIEIDNDTKNFYLEKYNECRAAYIFALEEMRETYFPNANKNDAISVDFKTYEVTLLPSRCSCGGSCKK